MNDAIMTKLCTACKSNLPLEMFHKNRSSSDGLNDYCKTCRKEQGKKWYEENRELQKQRSAVSKEKAKSKGDLTYGTHHCGWCGKTEPEVRFYRRKSGEKYYRHFLCTSCKREYNKKYPRKMTEEVKERQRELNRHNRSKKENWSRNILRSSKESDKRKGRVCDLTLEYVEHLLQQSDGCTYCGDNTARLSLDRIDCSIGHTMENVIVCCVRCNNFRGNMPFPAWMAIVPVLRHLRESGMLDGWKGRLPVSAEVKEHPNYRLCVRA